MNPEQLKDFSKSNIKLSQGWSKDIQLLYLEYCCKHDLSGKIKKEMQRIVENVDQ